MHFLVFDRTPQSFDENVVHETTASVHPNRDGRSLERAGEGAGPQGPAPHHAYHRLPGWGVEAVDGWVDSEHHAPRAVKRPLRMQLVDPPHHGQIVGAGDRPGTIDARTRQIQQRTLPANRQSLARPLDHRPALGDTHRPGLLAKKSLSTVNWPILV